jgi:hypothetical protein
MNWKWRERKRSWSNLRHNLSICWRKNRSFLRVKIVIWSLSIQIREEDRKKDQKTEAWYMVDKWKSLFFVLAFLKINCTEMMKFLIYYDCFFSTHSYSRWTKFYYSSPWRLAVIVRCIKGLPRNEEAVDIYSFCRETEKYRHESRGTWNQELPCWRGPSAIYPTGRRKLVAVAYEQDWNTGRDTTHILNGCLFHKNFYPYFIILTS